MIVHNRPKVTARSLAKPDTAGFMPRAAARMVREATAATHTRHGKHRGGPCPAVCIATLAGWSYGQASHALAKYGFTGRGATMTDIVAAMRDVFGRAQRLPGRRTVAEEVAAHFGPGQCGAVANARHIMPVVDGKLLNASHSQASAICTDVVLLPDLEIKR